MINRAIESGELPNDLAILIRNHPGIRRRFRHFLLDLRLTCREQRSPLRTSS